MPNYRRIIPEHEGPGRLGRHVNWDPRSLSYKVTAQPARALTSVLHQRQVPVFDQGDLGSCTGNAAVGAVATSPLFGSLPVEHTYTLDEAEAVTVYSAATKLDDARGTYPPTDTGSDGLSAAKACKALGMISGYLHATSLTAMQTALQDTPVIVGVSWFEGFDSPDSSGRVKISGSVRGGHEFEVVGMDVTAKTFLAVNSWGLSYGVNGTFTFSFDDMARLLSEDGDCTQLLPLSVPAPTPTPAPVVSDQDLFEWWQASKVWAGAKHTGTNKAAAAEARKLAAAKGL